MRRKVFHVVGVVWLIMVLGATVYAKSLMVKSDRALTPQPEHALVVFMRPSFVGGAFSASLFDVSNEETKFLGIIYYKTKVSYDVAPGEHTFMVIGESADFMKATVEAGKTYYVLVTPRLGGWKTRFSLRALRQADLTGADFSRWDANTELVENTPESGEWAVKNASSIQEKRLKYWPAWTALSPEAQESMILKPEDGR